MLSIRTRCWDAVDCVMDVLAIKQSMYCEELWASLEIFIYMDGFNWQNFSKLPTVAKGTRQF